MSAPDITKGERLLLDRAKWLISRFDSEGGQKVLSEINSLKGPQCEKEGMGEGGKEGVSRIGKGMLYGERPAGLDREIIPDISPSAEKIRSAYPLHSNTRAYRRGSDLDSIPNPLLIAGRMLLSFVDFLSEVTQPLSSSCIVLY